MAEKYFTGRVPELSTISGENLSPAHWNNE
jgi:hypothetical protein